MMLAKQALPTVVNSKKAKNDNRPQRRVFVQLSPNVPVTLVETEVFDLLMGSFVEFAANDNQRPCPNPSEIRGPPLQDRRDDKTSPNERR